MDMTWQKGLRRRDYTKKLAMGRWSGLTGWAPNNHRGSYKREAGGEGLAKEMEWWKQSSETQREVWRWSSADFEDRRGTSKELYTASRISTRLSLLEVPGGTRPANALTSAQWDRLWTSHLQNHKIINLCYLMLLNLWSFVIAAVGN